MSAYDTYLAANERMDALIDLSSGNDRSVRAIRARAVERFQWMRDFMAFLGDPQLSAPVIHVTGTSGKGSTATAIDAILRASGLRTLLHTSPYLQVSTEKVHAGGRLISARLLSDLTDEVIAAGQRFRPGELTYGEAWMALVFLAMKHLQPDVAIVEVGAGGRFDVSNVVQPDVAVITTVGIDHTESLGETLAEIAWHKAGIIKRGVRLVHSVTQPEAIAILEQEAERAGVRPIRRVASGMPISPGDGWIDDQTGVPLSNGIAGVAQVTNGMVAVAAARSFRSDLPIDAIATGLASARIPARFERMPGERAVILDGAHNEQKMASLVSDLTTLPRPVIAVVGFLASKRFEAMVRQLAPVVDEFVVAEPRVTGKDAATATQLGSRIAALTGKPATVASSASEAVSSAIERSGNAGSVVVTGSLYLCGQARERWYASAAIVEQQTQWPD